MERKNFQEGTQTTITRPAPIFEKGAESYLDKLKTQVEGVGLQPL